MDDKNIPFPAAAAYPIVSKNKNSVHDIFDRASLAAVALAETFPMPLVITAGIDRQRQILIRSNVMFEIMKRIDSVIISPQRSSGNGPGFTWFANFQNDPPAEKKKNIVLVIKYHNFRKSKVFFLKSSGNQDAVIAFSRISAALATSSTQGRV